MRKKTYIFLIRKENFFTHIGIIPDAVSTKIGCSNFGCVVAGASALLHSDKIII